MLRLNGTSNIGIASREPGAADQQVWYPRFRASRRRGIVSAALGKNWGENWDDMRCLVLVWRIRGGVGFQVAQEALKVSVVPDELGCSEEEMVEFLIG